MDRNLTISAEPRGGADVAGGARADAPEDGAGHLERRRLAFLTTLTDVTRALTEELDPTRVGHEILSGIQALFSDTVGQLWVQTPDGTGLDLVGMTGLRGPERAFRRRIRLGEGLAGVAAAEGRPLVTQDVPEDRRFANREWASGEGLVSGVALPLRHSCGTLGSLVILTRARYDFTGEELALLESFAGQAAIAIENARLHAGAIRRQEQLQALLGATRSIMGDLQLAEVLERIRAAAAQAAKTQHVKIFLLEAGAETLTVAAYSGRALPPAFRVQKGVGYTGRVAATGTPLFVADAQVDPDNIVQAQDQADGIRTYLGIPIRIRDQVLGVLTFNTEERHEYAADEMAFLASFADQAALAIENARLYETAQTQARVLETRVRERTAELEHALQVKAEFLARMSHELRTPLNHILGFADVLPHGAAALTPRQTRCLDRIREGGRHLLQLVDDLLEMSAAEAGGQRLTLETFLAREAVEEALAPFQVSLAQKRLTVELTIAAGLRVVAERRKFIQVATNLLSNAIKFTPPGGLVRVVGGPVPPDAASGGPEAGPASDGSPAPAPSGPDADPAWGWVELRVEDTGIGLAPESLERIFRGFEQVDGSASRQYGGAGIGLALVRTLVRLHGGQVWAESPGLGRGTALVVRWPHLPQAAPSRLLLVDDDPVVAAYLQEVLEEDGYQVTAAASGAAAQAAMAGALPDLVLLDLGLPDLDGLEVLRAWRGAERTRPVRVLVLTGMGTAKAEEALAVGADEFLTKPISPTVLVRTVQETLARRTDGKDRRQGPPGPDLEEA
jgi:signal transduction histidine kinase/ActR/RegA family two-component response regulator